MEYVQIETTGNALDFGDAVNWVVIQQHALALPIHGILAGGYTIK